MTENQDKTLSKIIIVVVLLVLGCLLIRTYTFSTAYASNNYCPIPQTSLQNAAVQWSLNHNKSYTDYEYIINTVGLIEKSIEDSGLNIDPTELVSITARETGLLNKNKVIISKGGDYGLLQIKYSNWSRFLEKNCNIYFITTLESNIQAGLCVIEYLENNYSGYKYYKGYYVPNYFGHYGSGVSFSQSYFNGVANNYIKLVKYMEQDENSYD